MKKLLTFIIAFALIFSCFGIAVFADNNDAGGIAESYETETENFYSRVYSAVRENSEIIMSALAAIASLLLAFTYKKGLLPKMRTAIDKLCSAVSKIKDASEEQSHEAKELIEKAEEKLNGAKLILENVSEKLTQLEHELNESIQTKDERERLRIIMLSQTEMLYDIFMSSALPQYQKDMVGERTAKIKEQINGGK